ncbi:MAG: glycoside hydrolase family 19 protein [Stappiaceae bacterium]|uniref:glycoside hydrolase family 19 protein n=1 Tax=Roseibium sp. TaxID=1936156 RepID=UPI003298B977
MDFTTFFSETRKSLFGGSFNQGQVDGINIIIDKMADFPDQVLRNQAAYILATAMHETGATMQPVRETFAKSDKQAMARLENAWKNGKLPWVSKPYWRKGWFGRGYVQLTHKANYKKMSDIIGIDLVNDRDLALEEDVAAEVLVEGMMKGVSGRGDFTKFKLEDFVNLTKSDYRNARKVVNGLDKATLIAGYAKKFEAALEKAGFDTSQTLNHSKPSDSDQEEMRENQIAHLQAQIAELKKMIAALQQ